LAAGARRAHRGRARATAVALAAQVRYDRTMGMKPRAEFGVTIYHNPN